MFMIKTIFDLSLSSKRIKGKFLNRVNLLRETAPHQKGFSRDGLFDLVYNTEGSPVFLSRWFDLYLRCL